MKYTAEPNAHTHNSNDNNNNGVSAPVRKRNYTPLVFPSYQIYQLDKTEMIHKYK